MTISAKPMLLLVCVCVRDILPYEQQTGDTDGKCVTENGDHAVECCDNYYPLNGSCLVCPDGTSKGKGETECHVCAAGFYGQNCALTCKCQLQQCNPVNGSCFIHQHTTEVSGTYTTERNNISSTRTTRSNKQIDYVSVVSYGTVVVLSVFTLTLGLATTFSLITRIRHSNTLESADTNGNDPQMSCLEPSDNAYYSVCDLDMLTLRQSSRRFSSLPNFIDNYVESMHNLTATSEGYLNLYQPLQSGWHLYRPKYESGRPYTVGSDSSEYYIPPRTQSNDIVVNVDVHETNQTSVI